MLFKRNAISSLLLELDSDDLPQSKKGQLGNCLAQEVMELIPRIECATPLLNREKEIIEKRGRNPQNYLMDSDIGTRDVLKRFYKNIYYNKDGKKYLVPGLTISELMIMLGVFNSILNSRTAQKNEYSKTLKSIRNRISKPYGCMVRKHGVEGVERLWFQEEGLVEDSAEETAFIAILDENMQLIKNEIYQALSVSEENLTEKNIARILRLSTKLARSYEKIDSEMSKRRGETPTLFTDVLLLECCGEDSMELSVVYEPNKQHKNFEKRLRQDKKEE